LLKSRNKLTEDEERRLGAVPFLLSIANPGGVAQQRSTQTNRQRTPFLDITSPATDSEPACVKYLLPDRKLIRPYYIPSNNRILPKEKHTMASNVLSDRDTNMQVKSPVNAAGQEKEKPKSLEYHRQMLESRLKEEQYVFGALPCLRNHLMHVSDPSNTFLHQTRSCLRPLRSSMLSAPSTS
jgi:hypothetical protein